MFIRVERWLLPERLEVLPILILAFNPHSPPRHKWATSSIFQAATGCGAQNFHIAIWGQPLPTRMFLFLKQDHSMAPPLRDMSSPGLIKPTSAIRWPSSLSLDIRLSGALSTLVPVLLCRKHNPALTASSVLPTSTAFIPISRARPTVLPVLPGCLAAPRSSAQHISSTVSGSWISVTPTPRRWFKRPAFPRHFPAPASAIRTPAY